MGTRERAIVRNLERQGFTLLRTGHHIVMKSPSGQRLVFPKSMGEGRALANTKAMIKRMGFTITIPKTGGRPGMV